VRRGTRKHLSIGLADKGFQVIRACIAAIGVVAALSAPRPVRVRTAMRYVRVDDATRTRSMNAFNRGLYLDSLIAPFESSDSLASPSRRIVRVQGSIEVDGNRARVCLMMLNVLARPITGPDTAVVQLGELDSVLTSYGVRYARILAQERMPASFSTARCP
jgi:hypothetical protein